MGVVVGEGKSGAGALEFIVRFHRVLKSAGLAHNGHRAVPQRHQLAQTAGFKQRRHQERIAARVYLARQGVGIINLRRNPVLILPCIVAEHVLVALVSGPQHHQLHVLAAQLIHHALDQVQSLLVRQAGHKAHHELLLVHRQSQLGL